MDALTHLDTFLRPRAHLQRPLSSHSPLFPYSTRIFHFSGNKEGLLSSLQSPHKNGSNTRTDEEEAVFILTIECGACRVCVCMCSDWGELWELVPTAPQGVIACRHLLLVCFTSRACSDDKNARFIFYSGLQPLILTFLLGQHFHVFAQKWPNLWEI